MKEQKEKFNQKKDKAIRSLKEVNFFLSNLNKTAKSIKIYKWFKELERYSQIFNVHCCHNFVFISYVYFLIVNYPLCKSLVCEEFPTFFYLEFF